MKKHYLLIGLLLTSILINAQYVDSASYFNYYGIDEIEKTIYSTPLENHKPMSVKYSVKPSGIPNWALLNHEVYSYINGKVSEKEVLYNSGGQKSKTKYTWSAKGKLLTQVQTILQGQGSPYLSYYRELQYKNNRVIYDSLAEGNLAKPIKDLYINAGSYSYDSENNVKYSTSLFKRSGEVYSKDIITEYKTDNFYDANNLLLTSTQQQQVNPKDVGTALVKWIAEYYNNGQLMNYRRYDSIPSSNPPSFILRDSTWFDKNSNSDNYHYIQTSMNTMTSNVFGQTKSTSSKYSYRYILNSKGDTTYVSETNSSYNDGSIDKVVEQNQVYKTIWDYKIVYYSNGNPKEVVREMSRNDSTVLMSQKWEFENYATGIVEVEKKIRYSVYPNPISSSTNLKINSDDAIKGKSYRVFSLSGITSLNSTFSDSKIDITTLRSGVYFLQIENESPIKFIVK